MPGEHYPSAGQRIKLSSELGDDGSMTRIKHIRTVGDKEKDFLKLFDHLTYSRSGWQVWEDLMTVMACSICNAVDRQKEAYEKREEQYERSIKALGGVDIPAQMLGIITMALEENPDQDFLGKLYMSLNLGSHWRGQFFTPYNMCRMMSEMNFRDGTKAEIKRKGYISVSDPCIGAGAMLLAAANTLKRMGINYQTDAVFVGQDIDRVAAMMAYIQLSLIGCPGYIIIGNSLTHPPVGHVLFPQNTEGREIWITPLFMHRIWELRRTNVLMQELCRGTETTQKTVEKEKGGVSMNNVKPGRQRIKNLLFKLNDEDRNTLVCLIAKAGYSVRIGKERPEGRGQTQYFVEFWEEPDNDNV